MTAKIQNSYNKCNCCATKGAKKKPLSDKANAPLLDTLAQLGTNSVNSVDGDFDTLISRNTKQSLYKRARRKFFSSNLCRALVDASRVSIMQSKLKKPYWSSYHCSSVVSRTSDGALRAKYCKNRWCTVCNAIRTAQLTNRYTPVFDSWHDVHFVTLTVPNCTGYLLSDEIAGMRATFKTIHERFKKRAQRGQMARFKGTRKIEVTYNPERNDFHPHFHVIVQGEANARELISSWLRAYPAADIKAQDCRRADTGTMRELFKYTTKLISKSSFGVREIHADALDVIFNSLCGVRTFQDFGFTKEDKLLISNDLGAGGLGEAWDEPNESLVTVAEYKYEISAGDWVDVETGECLTGYEPSEGMRELCEMRIVVRLNQIWARGYRNNRVRANNRTPGVPDALPRLSRIDDATARRVRAASNLFEKKCAPVLLLFDLPALPAVGVPVVIGGRGLNL